MWFQNLQYLQNYLETFMFICHLAAAVPVLETDNIIRIYHLLVDIYRDLVCFDGLYLKKIARSACSILGENIDNSFGPNGASLGGR